MSFLDQERPAISAPASAPLSWICSETTRATLIARSSNPGSCRERRDMNWIPCANELPPDGQIVDTISRTGLVQPLKRSGHLWFTPDYSSSVYYSPMFWRPVSEEAKCSSTG